MTIIRERDIAYNLLETGKTGEQTPQIRYVFFLSHSLLSCFHFSVKQVLVFYAIINQKNVYYPSIKIVIINYYGVNVNLPYVSLRILHEIFKISLQSWINIYKRRYNEFQEHQEHQETNRIRKIVANVLQKYPHLRDEEERVLEEYKKRYDFEQYPIPKRLGRRPKLRAHQTVWNDEEFIEKGILNDPNNEDFQRLKQEKLLRMRRKKK
jgi:hypothetical protein